jgi:hypothetical protein
LTSLSSTAQSTRTHAVPLGKFANSVCIPKLIENYFLGTQGLFGVFVVVPMPNRIFYAPEVAEQLFPSPDVSEAFCVDVIAGVAVKTARGVYGFTSRRVN